MIGPESPDEIHAIWHGFFASIKNLEPRPIYQDSEDEPHYFRLGYLIGDVVQLGILVFVISHFVAT